MATTNRLGDLMTQQWMRMAYEINMVHLTTLSGNGETSGKVRVDGIVLNENRELGLHIGLTQQVDVTHIPSGKRIGGFDTLGAAMEFAHRIAYLRDWKDDQITEPETKAISDLHATLTASAVRPTRV
jgi:hypothetical protein